MEFQSKNILILINKTYGGIKIVKDFLHIGLSFLSRIGLKEKQADI